MKNIGDDKTFTGLLMGTFSTGKTSLLGTGRLPVLIDSFDPGGTVVLRQKLESGEVLVRDWSIDNYKQPTAYTKWEAQWEQDIRNGFLKNFGTYAIDSLTTFITALSNHISKKAGRPPATLAIQDYTLIYATLRDIISLSSAQGCDFLMTAHLTLNKDDLTGEIIAEIDTYNKLKTLLPVLFSERYVLRKVEKASGITYEVLTNDQGRYKAGSRLANEGKIETVEKPNIKAILKKAGYNIDDKPLFL
jgi:hypothetical protein